MDADDEEATMVTCLAIAEKRPPGQRPSGCTGIFHQLFHWYTRLAKKKLLPNKLLSSASATATNSSSKRFGAHDKLPVAPKFHLIADENRGGFPKAKKSGGGHMMDMVQQYKHEMRPPSLVAKLMGLDSIPTVNKQKRAGLSHSQSTLKMDEKLGGAHGGCSKDDIVFEEGVLKNEPRAQKQQKAGQPHIHAVARFGPDSLQLKNILSRSRKHLRNHRGSNHTKLPVPAMVKSPRVGSGRNAARLFDAATKILEPQLRASNTRVNAITYSHFVRHNTKLQGVREGTIVNPPDPSTRSIYQSNILDNFEMLSPCKNSGLSNDYSGLQQVKAEQQSQFHFNAGRQANFSPQKLPSEKVRHCRSLMEQDNDKPYEPDSNQPVFILSQSQDCMHTHNEALQEKKPFNSCGRNECCSSSLPHESEVPAHSLHAFSLQQRKTNKMPFDKEKIPSRSNLSRLQSRRITSAVNGITEVKNMRKSSEKVTGQSRQKTPKKVDNVRFNQEMEQSTSKSQTRTPDQKKRIITGCGKVENSSSSSGKMGITKFDILPSCSSYTRSNSNSNSKFGSQGASKICTEPPPSFKFQSPARFRTKISVSKDKTRDAAERTDDMTEQAAQTSPEQPITVSPYVLGSLLKQKLKELTSQEETEQAGGRTQSKISKILKELISALATEHHTSNAVRVAEVSQKDEVSCHRDFSFDTIANEKAKKLTEEPSIRYLYDSDHLSPGSVLGASFSNSSCISSSLDNDSEIILKDRLIENAHKFSQPNAQMKHVRSADKRTTLALINSVTIMLEELGQHGTANKLSHIKEVILHAGLLLENGVLSKSGEKEFFICHFFNQLETFVNPIRFSSKDPPGFKEVEDKSNLTGILFDSAVEYLDSRFGNNSNFEYNLRRRLPLRLTAQQLIMDLSSEITQWADLAGKMPDELIEHEVSCSSGNWTDYEIEDCRISCELEEVVLQSLVEEILLDIYEINMLQD
ncbi:unnamed protein product [Rhodiola kirilowii]